MRIDLENLKESGGRFAQKYEPNQLSFEDNDVKLVDPIEVHGRVRSRNGEADLTGELHTRAAVPCGRCLQSIELPIKVSFHERFVNAVSWKEEKQHELQVEDLNLSIFDGETIDLDELVKEEILLALPGHVLCSDECQGLCPICGIDRNNTACDCETKLVDSRWEKLKGLQF